MSKNKHGDLFNTSLTEIIIILFFVLMLFALFNIDKVNKENLALGNEVDDLTFQKIILEEEKASFIKIIEADNEPSTLGPINKELTLQIAELKEDKRELEEQIQKLSPNDEPKDIQKQLPITSPDDYQIAGNCIDKTFWRQCAEWAWPIEIKRTPPVEFLFDIGMCSAGDIVVIKSDWERKLEKDFILVDGASTITDKLYIKRNEIIEFMSLIHDKSLDFKEGQTQHVARLINLELIDTDVSKYPRKAIGDEMNFIPTTRFEKKYEAIKERFPKNACDGFKANKAAKADALKEPLEDSLLKEPLEDSLKVNIKSNIPNIPESSKALFSWDYNIVCKRAAGKRNSEFNATFNVLVTAINRVQVQSYTYDKTNKNNRLLMLDAKESMEKQRKNIKPAINSENPDDNKIILPVKFLKDVCR